jgi:hypothetical protein
MFTIEEERVNAMALALKTENSLLIIDTVLVELFKDFLWIKKG